MKKLFKNRCININDTNQHLYISVRLEQNYTNSKGSGLEAQRREIITRIRDLIEIGWESFNSLHHCFILGRI